MDSEKIISEAKEKIANVTNLTSLEEVTSYYYGKKGIIINLTDEIKNLDNSEKPEYGKKLNQIKTEVESLLKNKKNDLIEIERQAKLLTSKIDLTIPGVNNPLGSIHIINQTIKEIEDFFIGRGFSLSEGPEVESDLYNFEYMNMPKGHPAREMHDSFYIDPNTLLRTHTSPVQARTMEKSDGKPLRIICPGKTYRRDNDDLTHSHQFTQIEGLVVDKGVSFANLKWILESLCKFLFKETVGIRLRPSYFPFTEPSVEVDTIIITKDGKKRYIELLGAGMVHPTILDRFGYDVDKYSGFAFGIGVERVIMIKNEIENIRNFYNNDQRFLKEFGGNK